MPVCCRHYGIVPNRLFLGKNISAHEWKWFIRDFENRLFCLPLVTHCPLHVENNVSLTQSWEYVGGFFNCIHMVHLSQRCIGSIWSIAFIWITKMIKQNEASQIYHHLRAAFVYCHSMICFHFPEIAWSPHIISSIIHIHCAVRMESLLPSKLFRSVVVVSVWPIAEIGTEGNW